jgi:hypothetical protein
MCSLLNEQVFEPLSPGVFAVAFARMTAKARRLEDSKKYILCSIR